MKSVTIEWASNKERLTLNVLEIKIHDNGCFVLTQTDGSLLFVPQALRSSALKEKRL